MTLALQLEYEALLESPTRERYLAVRQGLLQDPEWPVRSLDLLSVADAFLQGQWETALGLSDTLLPAWALSPRMHALRGRSAGKMGLHDLAELSFFESQACLLGLQATGDGTRTCPFVATYSSDAYDLLAAWGERSLSQRVTECDDRTFDVLQCRGGREMWCELPALDRRLTRRDRFQGLWRRLEGIPLRLNR